MLFHFEEDYESWPQENSNVLREQVILRDKYKLGDLPARRVLKIIEPGEPTFNLDSDKNWIPGLSMIYFFMKATLMPGDHCHITLTISPYARAIICWCCRISCLYLSLFFFKCRFYSVRCVKQVEGKIVGGSCGSHDRLEGVSPEKAVKLTLFLILLEPRKLNI